MDLSKSNGYMQEHDWPGRSTLAPLGSALRDHSEQGGLLGSRAVRLAFPRAFDAAEADAFRVLVVEDFDGVTVEDGDDWAGKVRINYKLGR